MKIAIPTDDWETISTHLRYSKGFAIFELEGNKIKSQEFRTNRFTVPVKGVKDDIHKSEKNTFTLNILNDCDVVILFLSDGRLIADLTKKGIEIVFTEEQSVENTLNAYLRKNGEIL